MTPIMNGWTLQIRFCARCLGLTLALFIAGTMSVRAQFVREFNPWSVSVDGQALMVPFWGGLDNPKPSLVDLNGDGLLDLLLGDAAGNLGYLRNDGTADLPLWTPVTARLGNINSGAWHTLSDIDADGDLDLFVDAQTGGVAFYRHELSESLGFFVLADSAWAGLPTVTASTPVFADLDGDNDYDYFLGALSGGLMFYRNDGDSTTASFTFVTDFYDSIQALGGVKNSLDPEHGSSHIQFVDIDADHDLDLFWGDLFNTSLYKFANMGDSVLSDLTYITPDFLPAPTFGFNHTTFGDLDGDGDFDMLMGVNNGATIDNFRLYENQGFAQNAIFVEIEANYLENIDLGTATIPTVGDIDGDGDFDILLGSVDGTVRLCENIGTRLAPSFVLNPEGLAGIDVGNGSAPWLVDWDNDSDLDLLIGTQVGYIELWINTGHPGLFQPELANPRLGDIKVDQVAIPTTADLNDDGRPDLIVGEWDFNGFANLLLYENIGPPEAPLLSLTTNRLITRLPRELTIPRFKDWDGDGRLDLILGGVNTPLWLYGNVTTEGSLPDSLTLVASPESLPGSGDTRRPTVAFADIDYDSDDDLFIGSNFGGLIFYRDSSNCCDGAVGNINLSADQLVDVADLTILIEHLFITYAKLLCVPAANIDVDSARVIDVADLTVLIDHLFINLQPLPLCE